MATNIASAGLVTAATEALVKAAPAINVIKDFAFDMSDEFDYNGTVKVAVVDAGNLSSFTLDNADFEDDSGTLTYVPVTLNELVKTTMSYTAKDQIDAPNSPWVEKFAKAMGQKLDAYVSQKIGAIAGDASITKSATLASVTKANLAKLREECAGKPEATVLVLAPAEYNQMIALFDYQALGDAETVKSGRIEKLYGFKSVVCGYGLPSGVKGMLISEDAIAFAARTVPTSCPEEYAEYGTVKGETGVALTVSRHGSAKTGRSFVNAMTYFGSKIIVADNIVKIA